MATKHVAVRLDEQTLVRVDALIPSLSTPWRKAKRSDVLRALIHAGLEAETWSKKGAPGTTPKGAADFAKPRKRSHDGAASGPKPRAPAERSHDGAASGPKPRAPAERSTR